MSIAQFFRILWARRWIILATTLSCFVAAVLVARSFPPRYQASSRVMLNMFKPDPVTGEAISSGFSRAYVKTQGELIRDYRISGRVVDDLGWMADPALQAAYARRDPSDTRDFRRWLAQRVSDNTSTGLVDASNILEIQFVSNSPEQSARIADTVRQAYVDQALSFKRDDAANNADWFRKQASRIRAELTAAEARKTAFERSNGIVLAENDTDTDSTRLNALASSSPAPAAAQIAAAQATVSPQLEQANAAIANAEKVLGPNNPELLAMKRQRQAILSTVASAQRSAPAVAAAGPSITNLYSAQQAKVLAQRGKVAEAQQLSADVRVLRDQYAKTSARAAELQQQGQSDETGLELLGSAVVPTSAEFPKWPLVIFGSLGLGFALGLLASLVVELLGRRVRSSEDLGFRDVPLLGVMGKAKSGARGGRGGNFLARLLPFRRTATEGGY
ncbi:hypothetical protein ASG29_00530 [Sphingomonas sp. Leaf412]|uniref:GumC family protein n=1 Tax=Sphingomonas sp. Leaf412 TaxID=1736370 RepID=UPI0006F54AA5|nr:Wzz/FepE/Etk N-terminal domain-containing protein [Sphingomonas sp. Leaf412]KQT34687.1 hypothetical protein ASG29_00530 [Sphingomonas sp. Leaf412]